ncbi:type I DNA topoisomerase [Rathayibacter toxicus]|uniref:DNA topoisomerase 1 n=1 Tax=Rathayibacter toxicus TaxID=145458 RepID=A0A0C5BIH5_9MICO|nr:type I DNA topoisomerase [Rathayibacter toxicus]AJM78085.1 DNA topoisomerase I [Rathayibacter toxicus]ALS57667.1 DNA topoisomerase I [Rathayibacter toxicus]KKM45013.1 DNA topoisomerase I [Rathayibacter toxicus]PPG20660.1 type I DNA topoisomerase [Rathayibacter toxicus]PPG45763.1 type I DNA topoisomerase [Rathayibacter toxicus]
MSGTKKLVIVESPAKAKTIAQYLGDEYEVLASIGHIRDLIEPKNLPPELKKGPLGKFSVDVDNGFEPYYVVSDQKKKTVADLKRALKNADELYLATDEDREGEAIAWHLLEELKPKVPVHRMVFHEITKDAIQKARNSTRAIDTSLVDAQETRRILDRLYGYEVSPVLWRKVGPGLSAGRVQSAATRLVVDRERERLAFVSASYWDLATVLAPEGDVSKGFGARLARLGGKRVAGGRDFDDRGQLKGDVTVLDEAAAKALADALRDSATAVRVSNLESKPYSRRPAAPFTTSTLQQEAARKLRFSARQTMSVAQSLYENGYITYMRTDSPGLSQQAVNAARSQAAALYGPETVPDKPRLYAGKSKNAQEAHEAIRPAGETFRTPDQLSGTLRGNDLRLYELIWKRTVASQMADAKGATATVTLLAELAGETARTAEFTASGTVITFRGFLLAYEEGRDEERHAMRDEKDAKLPPLEVGQSVVVAEVEAKGHETLPPPRYTEASLVKTLEELGIGRPSTYASIISTIVDRGYVTPRGTALVPNWIAFSVVRLLEDFFSELVEYDFTAEMEGDLDKIAGGEEDRVSWLNRFYFGGGSHPGLRHVVDNLGEIDAKGINSLRITDDITLRIGKYGPYLEVVEKGAEAPRRVNLPPELAPDELTPAKARELIDAPVQTDRVLGSNPDTGKIVVVKDGRFGPYVTEIDPEPSPAADPASGEAAQPAPTVRGARKTAAVKPRTSSLFKSMDIASIDLATALRLLDLPRIVGEDPQTGEQITAQNGRYGPYLKKGTDSRSLTSEDQIFDIDLPEALAVFAQPKYGARRASSALKEFEADPVSGKPIRIRDGRFGAYVTDGETNVTIPRGQTIEEIDFEQAVQMLADKRAKGPAKKTSAKKASEKKTTAKSTAAKSRATAATKSSVTKKPRKTATTRAEETTATDAAGATQS